MSNDLTAIFLAGGLGTRLRSEVPNTPKPMARVLGKPFLQHLFDFWIEGGISKIIVSVGYLSEQITEYFGTSYRGVPILYSYEETPLGTGGGFLKSLEMLDKEIDFFLINGDTFFEINIHDMLNFHKKKKSLFTMGLYSSEDYNRYKKIYLDTQKRISDESSLQKDSKPLINAGIYIFKNSLVKKLKLFGNIKCSFEDDLIPILLNYHSHGYYSESKFIDIGVPSDYRKAESILR